MQVGSRQPMFMPQRFQLGQRGETPQGVDLNLDKFNLTTPDRMNVVLPACSAGMDPTEGRVTLGRAFLHCSAAGKAAAKAARKAAADFAAEATGEATAAASVADASSTPHGVAALAGKAALEAGGAVGMTSTKRQQLQPSLLAKRLLTS